MNTITAAKKTYEVFESTECSRCSGQGRILGFSNTMGGICFKCNGQKYQLTKRGARDNERYRAAVDAVTLRPLADLQPGMNAKISDMKKYHVVESISGPVPSACGHAIKDADAVGGYKLTEDGKTLFVHEPVMIVRFKSEIVLNGPLGKYKQQEFEVGLSAEIRIHAGDAMPKAEDFDSRKVAA